ncbi:unnamed protein product [Cylindrotheca closterium]|uniref:Uncharacterized protein n=1 Tax=Cylindrotheca closterium TaxID=2856 RepID=A0AAD2PUB6_9STRA|nr:unnamed protein product [Cylindrotheca closterium]
MAPLIDETNFYLDESPSSFERSSSPSSFFKEHEGRQKKSVSFSVMSDLYLIPHAKDMKKKEKEAYWMNKKDFRRIEQENFYTLDAMVTEGNFPISDKDYFRGLENLMPEARSKRKQRIHFVVNAILKEQRKNRVLNDQWVEKFNKIYTSKSAQAAYNKGIWDATEATRTEASKCNPEVWI